MSGRGGYKMNDQNTERTIELSNTMFEMANKLDNLLIAAQQDETVILTPKQVTDMLILIGELTLINTGINGAMLEESAFKFEE